ncbi:hypothetical protein WH06_21360 [Aeromonas salmonicida subsp. salmonicida]|uniref:DUF7079 domain-containing protein n=3 Tax=Aeromonas salmonicida TaxID=645 RepID=A4SLC0_AERS4|nr:hypothetical protein [Aeromonas salmonicida]ABO89692.1 conserved hypothetical protein [Aeromonas salmonicida subsp. salmonicida A449]AYO62774.1 hypothetical protein C5P03_08080 [Aeromonas salmonicida subsp. salmonicida 01-B526]EHI52609.1 hypothetical protein IYQ_10202 [Aeromonas salmonicida subsp. salmonicida 01-B526]EKP0241497.1 hypothetical protein [Aeromonas salmonicida]EKP0245587.1 hypothetical protein [Aeromonas salmonicida]
MKEIMSDIALCEALSGLFVDDDIDYRSIVRVARTFPTTHVEKVLFEWVAPVCYINMLAPDSAVWSGFERDALWAEIQCLLAVEAGARLPRRLLIRIRSFYLRRLFADEWRKLSALLAEKG